MIPPNRQGYALKRGEGRSIDFRGTKMTVKVPGVQVGESYSLIEMVHPPTVGRALRVHPTEAGVFAGILLVILAVCLGGCSYVEAIGSQAGYGLRQMVSPEQRVYKHMVHRATFFVFGKIINAGPVAGQTIAVIALSDQFRPSEVVDVNHVARADSYYGLNLPPGEYRLVVVGDLNRDGRYDETEVVGSRAVSLRAHDVPDMVLGGYDIDLAVHERAGGGTFRVEVPKTTERTESLIYPKGTLRSMDDPIFAPQMADLGLYEPAAFLEAAPMMFYALEEDNGFKVPVVFVHGIGGTVRDFDAIVAALDRTRFRPWFFYYPSGSDVDQLAAMFYKIFLSGTVIPLGDMPLVIVAHSMGGLVVREALNRSGSEQHENRVARLITVASPMGGHPDARNSVQAPVAVPSWLDLNPDSAFIANLHRKPLPAGVEYHLFFAFGDDRRVKVGVNSDGRVPLASQLTARAQQEAMEQHGFDETHSGILTSPQAIADILRIVSEVRAPIPEPHMREGMRGGYRVDLGPQYTPLEAYCIHNLGFYLDALASGALDPISPVQEHFIRAIRGDVPPTSEMETAWIKFNREYPDRRAFAR